MLDVEAARQWLSRIDQCRAANAYTFGLPLAGARTVRFRHNDVEHLDALAARHRATGARVLVAVDGVYSMDGDIAPLAAIVEVKQRHGAFLLLDESHAVGVLGPDGCGTPACRPAPWTSSPARSARRSRPAAVSRPVGVG